MKLSVHYSKWGNMYKSRSYINGLRVTEAQWDAEFNASDFVVGTGTTESIDSTSYRVTYTHTPNHGEHYDKIHTTSRSRPGDRS